MQVPLGTASICRIFQPLIDFDQLQTMGLDTEPVSAWHMKMPKLDTQDKHPVRMWPKSSALTTFFVAKPIILMNLFYFKCINKKIANDGLFQHFYCKRKPSLCQTF